MDVRIDVKGQSNGSVKMSIDINIPPELAERGVSQLIKEGLDILLRASLEHVGAPVMEDGKFEFHGDEARAMRGVSVEEFFQSKKKGWN